MANGGFHLLAAIPEERAVGHLGALPVCRMAEGPGSSHGRGLHFWPGVSAFRFADVARTTSRLGQATSGPEPCIPPAARHSSTILMRKLMVVVSPLRALTERITLT